MSPLIAPLIGPTVALDTPAPVPPLFTLLGAAQLVEEADAHWGGGARLRQWPCATTSYWPLRPDTAARKQAIAACAGAAHVDAFTVYLAWQRSTLGMVASEERERALTSFLAAESMGVEAGAWRGDLGAGAATLGFAIGDATPLNAAAVSPARALGLLEGAAHTRGVIHARPEVVTAWLAQYLVESTSPGKLTTMLGTLVVPGLGYPADLVGSHSNGADVTKPWAVLTGQVQIRRTPQPDVLSDPVQTTDRTNNVSVLYVERDYLVITDACQHVAVQVDLTSV